MGIWNPKFVDCNLIYRLQENDGLTLSLGFDNKPHWLEGAQVYASACASYRRETWHDTFLENVVGGIDIFRPANDHARNGVLYKWNKDHYTVCSDNRIYAYGPFKDKEHWLPTLPLGLDTAALLKTSALFSKRGSHP